MGLRHLPWPRTLNWPAQLLGDTSGLGSLIFSAKLNFFIPFTPVILGSCTSSWPGFAGVFVFCFGTLKFSLRYSLSSGRSGLLRWQLAWFAWVSGSGFSLFCATTTYSAVLFPAISGHPLDEFIHLVLALLVILVSLASCCVHTVTCRSLQVRLPPWQVGLLSNLFLPSCADVTCPLTSCLISNAVVRLPVLAGFTGLCAHLVVSPAVVQSDVTCGFESSVFQLTFVRHKTLFFP